MSDVVPVPDMMEMEIVSEPGSQRAPTGSAVLYGKIERIQPGQVDFRLVEWVSAPDARIRILLPGPEGSLTPHDIGSADFMQRIEDRVIPELIPFIFTTRNGTVTEIEEQYVP